MSQNKKMNSIRGRILIAFLVLCLLTTPLVIFSYNSLKKINTGKSLKERVALFNINRLKANNTFSRIISTDTKIDSFYLFGTTDHIGKYNEFMYSAGRAIEDIATSQYVTDEVVDQRIKNIQLKLAKLKIDNDSIITYLSRRGFRDFGLEGNMRSFIHQLENVEVISLSENLSLRRREKDYFLRDDHQYAKLLNDEAQALIKRMAQNPEQNAKSLAILQGYQESFNAIVALESIIGNENSGLISEVFRLNKELDKEVKTLYEVIDKNLLVLTNSIKSYVLLFFFITVVFAIIFSIVFSGHISRPIQRLISDMALISEKKFKGNILITSDVKVKEINQLTATYNSLINKIRAQINDLNEKNVELKFLNERLQQSEEELKEASRVKDRFFSIISHDLRGHTANVLSLSKLLGPDMGISDKEKEVFTKYLVDTSQNLQLLLDNLLHWAKSQMNDHEISKKSFNLNSLINENISLYMDNAERKGVKICFEPVETSKAYADKDMVDFILRNLLSNALKFTKKGDNIFFKILEVEHDLKIEIQDTGVGMEKNQIKKLLNSNREGFTTKGTQNEVGTGLGFSICMDFVKRNGGQMQINSKVGQGSTFSFTLPTKLTRESIVS